ncbi:MAG: hypothetical protein FJ096_07995 [Deltaproteobacteria bacterium]|nr:hypothetical protein [Deltaproteobacteria bacterium]
MKLSSSTRIALPIVFSLGLAAACGTSTNGASTTAGSGGNGTSASTTGQGGSIDLTSGSSGGAGGGLDDNTACAKEEAEATLTYAPVDIIFVIDNSGSMTESIGGVQANINDSFAKIIEASGVDYRVIMLTRHGKYTSGQSVCIEAPLSGIAKGGCAAPPATPVNNPSRFFHYSQEISSHDALCQILRTYSAPDEHQLAPNGWKEWLRPDALKLFVVVTDDSASCSFNGKSYKDGDTSFVMAQTVANDFNVALTALDTAQFGDVMNRKYRFHSIVAIADKDPKNPATPWPPNEPLNTSKCGSNPNPGVGYQALSVLTEGLRFPLCSLDYYDAIFNELAKGVISGAALSCNFPIPEPPAGQMIDRDTIVVQFTPGDGGAAQNFQQVASEGQCGPGKFFLVENQIQLCKDTCDVVGKDKQGKIKVLFGCIGISN